MSKAFPGRARRTCPGLLAQVSCALCLAHDGIEHRLAQRTRLLDLLSAGVPIVCTQGDALGDLAVRAGAAISVAPGDAAAAARAVARFLGDAGARRSHAEAGRLLAAEMAPERTLAEAVAWLAAPVVSERLKRSTRSRWRKD